MFVGHKKRCSIWTGRKQDWKYKPGQLNASLAIALLALALMQAHLSSSNHPIGVRLVNGQQQQQRGDTKAANSRRLGATFYSISKDGKTSERRIVQQDQLQMGPVELAAQQKLPANLQDEPRQSQQVKLTIEGEGPPEVGSEGGFMRQAGGEGDSRQQQPQQTLVGSFNQLVGQSAISDFTTTTAQPSATDLPAQTPAEPEEQQQSFGAPARQQQQQQLFTTATGSPISSPSASPLNSMSMSLDGMVLNSRPRASNGAAKKSPRIESGSVNGGSPLASVAVHQQQQQQQSSVAKANSRRVAPSGLPFSSPATKGLRLKPSGAGNNQQPKDKSNNINQATDSTSENKFSPRTQTRLGDDSSLFSMLQQVDASNQGFEEFQEPQMISFSGNKNTEGPNSGLEFMKSLLEISQANGNRQQANGQQLSGDDMVMSVMSSPDGKERKLVMIARNTLDNLQKFANQQRQLQQQQPTQGSGSAEWWPSGSQQQAWSPKQQQASDLQQEVQVQTTTQPTPIFVTTSASDSFLAGRFSGPSATTTTTTTTQQPPMGSSSSFGPSGQSSVMLASGEPGNSTLGVKSAQFSPTQTAPPITTTSSTTTTSTTTAAAPSASPTADSFREVPVSGQAGDFNGKGSQQAKIQNGNQQQVASSGKATAKTSGSRDGKKVNNFEGPGQRAKLNGGNSSNKGQSPVKGSGSRKKGGNSNSILAKQTGGSGAKQRVVGQTKQSSSSGKGNKSNKQVNNNQVSFDSTGGQQQQQQQQQVTGKSKSAPAASLAGGQQRLSTNGQQQPRMMNRLFVDQQQAQSPGTGASSTDSSARSNSDNNFASEAQTTPASAAPDNRQEQQQANLSTDFDRPATTTMPSAPTTTAAVAGNNFAFGAGQTTANGERKFMQMNNDDQLEENNKQPGAEKSSLAEAVNKLNENNQNSFDRQMDEFEQTNGNNRKPMDSFLDSSSGLNSLRASIPGEPAQDYPIYSRPPKTSFDCQAQSCSAGYYADLEAKCQVFHICQNDGRSETFLCPNGTIFSQQHFVCVWWWQVDCQASREFYKLNDNIYCNSMSLPKSPVTTNQQQPFGAASVRRTGNESSNRLDQKQAGQLLSGDIGLNNFQAGDSQGAPKTTTSSSVGKPEQQMQAADGGQQGFVVPLSTSSSLMMNSNEDNIAEAQLQQQQQQLESLTRA